MRSKDDATPPREINGLSKPIFNVGLTCIVTQVPEIVEITRRRKLDAVHQELAQFVLAKDFFWFSDEFSDANYAGKDLDDAREWFFQSLGTRKKRSEFRSRLPYHLEQGDAGDYVIVIRSSLTSIEIVMESRRDSKNFFEHRIVFDCDAREVRVTVRLSYVQKPNDGGPVGWLSAFRTGYQTEQFERIGAEDCERFVQEIASGFQDYRVETRSGQEVVVGEDLPSDLAPMRKLAFDDLQRLFNFEEDIQVDLSQVLLHRQVALVERVSFEKRNHGIIGDAELVLLRSGHGVVTDRWRYGVLQAWGPNGGWYSDGASEIERPKNQQLVLSYLTTQSQQPNTSDKLESLQPRSLWHYVKISNLENLNSVEGMTFSTSWLVVPFDGLEWRALRESLLIDFNELSMAERQAAQTSLSARKHVDELHARQLKQREVEAREREIERRARREQEEALIRNRQLVRERTKERQVAAKKMARTGFNGCLLIGCGLPVVMMVCLICVSIAISGNTIGHRLPLVLFVVVFIGGPLFVLARRSSVKT